ncbi:MAG: TIGR04255 family protein [Candidatus Thiodiazotropha sp. (ex Epidulcina cf. delphinae)]|nr:TIGR04255 family protein [Candidatus Thiodiazotropha sp. (ex Epidulcina cf. delphinae)]
MIEKRHLSHAPIKEALIDIQVALPEKVTTETLNSKYAQIAGQYPKHETLQRGEFGLHSDEGQPTKVTIGQSMVGYRYTSEDRRRVAQFRVDGFTFSQLEPYGSWDEMKEEAVRLWEVYAASVSPDPITRVGARYINVLKLPLNTELEEYLTAPPTIPEGLNQELSSFLTRIEISDPTIESRGILTQALEGVHGNYAPIVLDIEVFITKQFDPQDEEFWCCLDQLRNFKNTVFFESITEKAAELFQ